MPMFTHVPTSEALVTYIRERIPEFVSGHRLQHTFFVEKEAVAIAQSQFLLYNIPCAYLNDVRAAALLHDITKQVPLEQQLTLCKTYHIEAGDYPSSALLHAKTGAYVAKDTFDINAFVFSAIYHHTTGKIGMNLLDKIIFLADYIEPSRSPEHCKATRKAYYQDCESPDALTRQCALENAMLMSIDGTISYLISQKNPIDITTVLTRNDLLKQLTFQNKEQIHG